MADLDDARRAVASLPDVTVADDGQFAISVQAGAKQKGMAWSWMERTAAKQPRIPNRDVLAVRVDGAEEKEALLAADPDAFFTEPHYNGFPAVLVRLAEIDPDQLAELLVDAWRIQAPKKLVKAWEAETS